METSGLEPPTPGLQSGGSSNASVTDKELTATPPAACTRACTSDTENDYESNLESIAAALRKLSPEDRERLTALLNDNNHQKLD